MVTRKFGLTLILSCAVATGCSGGGFGGLGGAKDGGKGKAGSSSKEEASGGEDEDQEGDEADTPAEVAGAFLTVACAPTATKPAPMPEGAYEAFGCAVIDVETRLFYPDASISNVVFAFSEGAVEVVPLVAAPAGGPWHAYTYVESAKAALLKSVRGFATANGQDIETVNVDLEIYDPEHLVRTTEDEKATSGENGLILQVVGTDPPGVADAAKATIDAAPATIWNVSGAEEPHHIWVIYDLGGLYQLKQVVYDLCSVMPDAGTITASDEVLHLGLGTLKDPVTIGQITKGDTGADRPWEVDAATRPLRFVKFYLEEEGSANSVCLNSVRVFGSAVP